MNARLTLKTRFTLVAAGAVAAVALAITAVTVAHQAHLYRDRIPKGWVPPHSSGFGLTYTQVITSAGVVWAPPGDAGLLTPSVAAIDVAAGRASSFYATAQVNGTRAMVLTAPLAPGIAVQVAEPLTATDAAVARVGATLGAQRRLVSDASHELRTPLASLRINVDVLAEHPDMPTADRTEVLARVTDQVAELSRLVASVTDLARGEPPAADRFPVYLNAVVSDALEAARRDWPKAEFSSYLAGDVALGTAERLRVAVKNLLDNAAKFGPPDGPVELRLVGGELTVRDHG